MTARRKKKAGALPEGRLPRGEAGAAAIAQELRSWAGRLGNYLDSRPDRSKPVSVTELRNKLMRRRLNLAQAERALLSGLLNGHLGVVDDDAIYDSRCLVAGDAQSTEVRTRTVLVAEKLVAALVNRHANDPERSKTLALRLSWRVDAIPSKIQSWGHFPLESRPSERAGQRRIETTTARQNARQLFNCAVQRDKHNNWGDASPAEHAMALITAVCRETGITLDDARLATLHKAATKRIEQASQLGVSPGQVCSVLTRYWTHEADRQREYNLEFGKATRVPYAVAFTPITRRRSLLAHLEGAGLVLPKPATGGVRLGLQKGGTVTALTVPPPAKANSAKNKGNGPRLGVEKSGASNRALTEVGVPIYTAQSLRKCRVA